MSYVLAAEGTGRRCLQFLAGSLGTSIALGSLLLPSVILESGCASRAVPTHGPTVPPAATAAPGLTPGQLLAPPSFGRGLPDLDRVLESRREPTASAEAAQAVLATTNLRATQTDFASESETTVAVDPNNPLHLVVGAITSPNPGPPFNRHYSTLDGGQTWSDSSVAGQLGFNTYGDPAVAYCGDGSVYYASLTLFRGPTSARSGIMVDRSTDGGITWPEENRSTVVDRTSGPDLITDKPWITCDTTNSAFAGRIYVVWTDPQLVPAGNCTTPFCRALKIKRSTDSGATWSTPVMVSDNPQTPQNGAALAIGPSGELYVSWVFILDENDPVLKYKFDKSTDGGITFGVDKTAFSITDIADDPHFRRGTYPSMDADRSNGPYRGNIYIAFADSRNGDADILLVRSTDGGTSWSAPIRVNDDPLGNGADQWAQGLAVDPLGRVVVTWSDRRRFAGTERYEVWGAISRDGGQTFDTNFLIGDTPSDAPVSTFLGDYDSVAVTSDRIYAIWADQRPGLVKPADIYTDAFPNTFRYDEVKGVVWSGASQMSFDTQDARFGVDLNYDVAGGLLSELRSDQTFLRASCTAPTWPDPPFVDNRVPPQDDGYYYLLRAHGPAGVGTYGDASPARPNPRDPLDEALITCP